MWPFETGLKRTDLENLLVVLYNVETRTEPYIVNGGGSVPTSGNVIIRVNRAMGDIKGFRIQVYPKVHVDGGVQTIIDNNCESALAAYDDVLRDATFQVTQLRAQRGALENAYVMLREMPAGLGFNDFLNCLNILESSSVNGVIYDVYAGNAYSIGQKLVEQLKAVSTLGSDDAALFLMNLGDALQKTRAAERQMVYSGNLGLEPAAKAFHVQYLLRNPPANV